ncbi:hypothetical protein FA95DRAFT_1506705 [Auriscalpium vulgare]|uniref:Uncharacterized protein n=1 Tax=Auriscalpium vulgare TaxID=40419 RepID=A0ACB8R0Q8_9AGAM|nr:hypothetical protein FA95DRAFT_1506705 [Auriscalpium vulgare]
MEGASLSVFLPNCAELDARTPYVILDCDERIIAVLVGMPVEGDSRAPEDRWEACIERIAQRLEDLRTKNEKEFKSEHLKHRRGNYALLSAGISYGGGPKRPYNLSRGSKRRASMIDSLLGDQDVQRVIGFENGTLAAYYPKAYLDMCKRLTSLYESQPELKRNFSNSAYPTVSFNMGPETVTDLHNDCTNYPGLPCALTALGSFNADLGGRLILSDLKLKIRFPSGATILLPSAGLRHGNTAIQPGEKRYSITQYCIGALMRWVHHGLRPASGISASERAKLDADQWEAQLSRLSKHGELAADRKWLAQQLAQVK